MNRGLLAVAALASLSACGGSWKVIRQAPADQLAGKSAFVLAPSDFSQVKVGAKTEEQFLATSKDPASAGARWADVKTGIHDEIAKGLAARAKGLTISSEGSGMVIKPIVEYIDPGCPTGFCHSALRVTVQITAADGSVLDEVQFESRHSGSIVEATDERRLRADSQNISRDLADYLKGRVAGK